MKIRRIDLELEYLKNMFTQDKEFHYKVIKEGLTKESKLCHYEFLKDKLSLYFIDETGDDMKEPICLNEAKYTLMKTLEVLTKKRIKDAIEKCSYGFDDGTGRITDCIYPDELEKELGL